VVFDYVEGAHLLSSCNFVNTTRTRKIRALGRELVILAPMDREIEIYTRRVAESEMCGCTTEHPVICSTQLTVVSLGSLWDRVHEHEIYKTSRYYIL